MTKHRFKTQAFGLSLLIALAPGAARAVEVLDTHNLTLDLGASFEQLGELENTSNNSDEPGVANTTHRDNTRVYLFQTEDRLLLNGDLDGTKFYFEEALGGESISTSNNQMNLYQMYAQVPLNDEFSAVVGQFKVPSSLSSAEDIRSLMFTETSPLFSTFFNQGYDNGVGLAGKGDGWDATLGTISGSPDLPQRYLPEIFVFPPMLYTRFGVGDISDDAYRQKQAVDGLKAAQWGVHLNGEYVNDSNAGHSDDLALQNTDATTVSSDNIFGNALLWKNWNPYLGLTSNGVSTSRIDSNYWDASLDAQYRSPLGDDATLILTGQWSFAEFNNEAMDAASAGRPRATINLTGGEFVAGIDSDPWALAGRFDIVLPSDTLSYTAVAITGDKPLYELTFPSLSFKVNKYVHLTAETLFWLNSPEAIGDDGVYELLEMPSQVTDITAANPIHTNPLVCVGRMAFTLAF